METYLEDIPCRHIMSTSCQLKGLSDSKPKYIYLFLTLPLDQDEELKKEDIHHQTVYTH